MKHSKQDSEQTFSSFSLSPELFRAIDELGFTSPTPIQSKTIPLLLKESTDFLGLASTGTGKTAAFAIPLLQGLEDHSKRVQALILCPTRELAKQVSEQINFLARYKRTKALAIYGGSDYGGQLRALKEGVSIVVGTPGRIIDHLERGTLDIGHLQTIVLDEADEMISMGFRDEIERILSEVDQLKKLRKWMFSATMNSDIRKIADRFLKNPKQISIDKESGGATSSVSQFYFNVHEDQKVQLLENLIDSVPDFHGLVFCQTKALTEEVAIQLKMDGFSAECLHGDMDQKSRERVMKSFKSKAVTVLICTDVAARGIDVKDLSHVINYSLPRELENYVHRIGRTGRGGKMGVAWNLVNPSHFGLIYQIERITKMKMIRLEFPKEQDILIAKASKALRQFQNQEIEGVLANQSQLTRILGEGNWKATLDSLTKEEIVARFLSKSLKVNSIGKSIHDPSRRKEGESRFDRRKAFVERTGRGSKAGFSKKPRFSTFSRMAKDDYPSLAKIARGEHSSKS